MVKTRRLSDLYIRGVDLEVNDDQGEPPIKLWVKKLNTVEHDEAVRHASGTRALYLVNKDKKDSEEWIRIRGELDEMGAKDLFMELVVREDLLMRRMRVEAEVAAEEQWSKDGYLQGLQDLWNNGMSAAYAVNVEDPEAKKVFDELKRYQTQVEDIMTGEKASLLRDWEDRDYNVLLDRATEEFIRRQAGIKFMEAFEEWELFFAVRDQASHDRYFEDISEVRSVDDKVKERLLAALNAVQVDPVEGKDSAATPVSLPSSEQPEQAATDDFSGPDTPPQ